MDTLARDSVVAIEPDTWLHEGWVCHPRAGGDPIGVPPTPERHFNRRRDDARPAPVPGTVALALDHDVATPRDFDAEEWWYRTSFRVASRSRRHYLRFESLATHAEAWLNGERILESRNMFRRHRVDVTHLLREENTLELRFLPLAAALAEKKPRPRWKTALVRQQNFRWIRTTLLGRIPAWSPEVPPVGPVGGIALESLDHVDVERMSVVPSAEGGVARLAIDATIHALEGAITSARMRVGETLHALRVKDGRIEADLTLPDAPLWWPHTHGKPATVTCQLELEVAGTWRAVDVGQLGFRDVTLDRSQGAVQFVVNGTRVFARGACWSPADFRRLHAGEAELRRTLTAARDAGMNMIRVGGTMAYESDAFYRLCDELGLLVWQDFMFANMDYPFRDAAFAAEAEAEIVGQLERLKRHGCVAAFCGGSEIAQQAAMLGLAPEHGCADFLRVRVADLVEAHCPGIPYFPNSPWGGAMPMHVSTGIAHYYGVGAYRRPLEDVRRAKVKFATECLGIANVPDEAVVREVFGGPIGPAHHPAWKARVSRDSGSGYDFEDVRDFYLRELFAVDPIVLRSQDPERYYALSRATSAEVMSRVFAEWRAPGSGCGGGLVWFMRDLWPGAGWGVMDSHGAAKAPLRALARAWAARTVRLTDEGLDGVNLHVFNDGPAPWRASVEIELIRAGKPAAAAKAVVELRPHDARTLQADALLGYFTDCNNAYRFGPAKFEAIVARVRDADTGACVAEDFLFPKGMSLPLERDAGITTRVVRENDRVSVELSSAVFLQDVRTKAEGFVASDSHFHLSPSCPRRIDFYPGADAPPIFEASIEALNLSSAVTVREAQETQRERQQ